MKKFTLLAASVCLVFASLAGFPQSGSATTLFGLDFDFGEDGGGWLQFDVDPQNLPFDQWIDLTTTTGLQTEFTMCDPTVLSLCLMGTTDQLTILTGSVSITDANPLFPVQLSQDFFLSFLLDLRQSTGPLGGLLATLEVTDSAYSGLARIDFLENPLCQGSISLCFGGAYPAPEVWFDDPIPPVPIPATVWLFGSGLGLLGWIGRKRTLAA